MSNLKLRTFQIVLVVISLLIVALVLPLIGNIHEIEFKVGRPVDFSMSVETGGMPPDSPGWYLFTVFLRILFVLAGIAFVYQFIANRSSRRMYIFFFVALGSILLISELLDWDQRDAGSSPETPIEIMWDGPIEQDLNLPTEDREVEPSNALAILLAIALSSVVVVVGAIALRKWLKSRSAAEDDGYGEILDSITDAAHRLRAGEDPRTVVLFCYQEMLRILSIKGKLDATFLTPREFEVRLRSLGMSGDSISQLTSIFEIVRYADRVDNLFAAHALTCLEAIQEAHETDES